MLAMEMENIYPDLSRFCPCSVCSRKSDCADECLRFKEYVMTKPLSLRKKRWVNFKNNGGEPII